jgi:hypothetical protein
MAAKKVSKVKSVEVQKQEEVLEEEPVRLSHIGKWMRANKGFCEILDWKAVMK